MYKPGTHHIKQVIQINCTSLKFCTSVWCTQKGASFLWHSYQKYITSIKSCQNIRKNKPKKKTPPPKRKLYKVAMTYQMCNFYLYLGNWNHGQLAWSSWPWAWLVTTPLRRREDNPSSVIFLHNILEKNTWTIIVSCVAVYFSFSTPILKLPYLFTRLLIFIQTSKMKQIQWDYQLSATFNWLRGREITNH